MSYDLKLLVMKQNKVKKINFPTSIIVKNEIEDGFNRYNNIWTFMTSIEGVWYSLVKEHDGLFDAFPICDSDFEKDEKDIDMPYWIDDEDIKYDLTPLLIKNEFRIDFQKIVEDLVNSSPIKMIMILASYQSHNKETICGAISLTEYLSLLDRGKILFNVCYIVRS
ncbi:MAG: hypothetical protein ABRQ25_16865 [Clostridiaceae bacterium]